MKTVLVILLLVLSGCTDSKIASIASLGSSGHIQCFSGSFKFYDGQSTGKITSTENSDGWEFKDAQTGKFIRVSGPCLIEN